MLKQAFDRDELQQYVSAVRDNLGTAKLKSSVDGAAAVVGADGDPADALRSQITDLTGHVLPSAQRTATPVPYFSRDPVHSLLQTSIEENLRKQGVSEQPGLLDKIVHGITGLLHPRQFGPTDPNWVIDVARSMLDRLADGNHPFNPVPARHEIEDTARIVIVGDWGTGVPRAREVAKYMAEEVSDAIAAGRQVHVIHLGDVYYSGTPKEVDRRVLAHGLWPVTTRQASDRVTSWSLNGNHDMYGGGYGYYDRLLADPRFAHQRAGDGTTSFFTLVAPSWEFVALDTAWDPDVLAQGHVGVLQDPQAEFAAKAAAQAREANRKLVLLSHHQLVSVYDPEDIGTVLPQKLAPVLKGGVNAWIWGHEHRCMGFEPVDGVKFARCIGHGGVPVRMDHAPNDPIKAPGMWEERGFVEQGGDRWQRFGFAVLDLTTERAEVRYRTELGVQTRTETIS
jgi:hypothetical protein